MGCFNGFYVICRGSVIQKVCCTEFAYPCVPDYCAQGEKGEAGPPGFDGLPGFKVIGALHLMNCQARCSLMLAPSPVFLSLVMVVRCGGVQIVNLTME